MAQGQVIITQAVERIRTGVVLSMQSFDRIGTGNTIKEMTVVSNPDGAKLEAPYYIDDLETGRKGMYQPPKDRPPASLERIREWCIAKGINAGAAHAIKKKIDRVGYSGKPGVLSQPLSDEVVDPIIDEALGKIALIVGKEVNDLIKVK